jgi:hypothetical protein
MSQVECVVEFPSVGRPTFKYVFDSVEDASRDGQRIFRFASVRGIVRRYL